MSASILIVNDDSDVKLWASSDLGRDPYWERVDLCTSIAELRSILENRHPIDVALIDVRLEIAFEGLTGFDIARDLKLREVKVGLYSGSVSDRDKERAREIGAPIFDTLELGKAHSNEVFRHMAREVLSYSGAGVERESES